MTSFPFEQMVLGEEMNAKGLFAGSDQHHAVVTILPGATVTVNANFTLPRSTTADKGHQITSMELAWIVNSGAVNPMAMTLDRVEYADSTAPASNVIAPTDTTFTPLAAGTQNLDVWTPDTPDFYNGASPYVYRFAMVLTNSSATANAVVTINGLNVLYDFDAQT